MIINAVICYLEKMLTKHFYRLDEVCAALHWAILTQRYKEIAFWCLELIDSDFASELVETLIKTWAYSYCIIYKEWFPEFIEVFHNGDRDSYIGIAFALAKVSKRDNTVIAILTAGLVQREVPDRIHRLELTAENAIRRKKTFLAWCLLRGKWNWSVIPDGTTKSACCMLEDYMDKWVLRAVALTLATTDTFELEPTQVNTVIYDEVVKMINEWDTLLGRRARRVYKIPVDCLLYITRRGRMSVYKDTLDELRNDVYDMYARKNPEMFPDDIPDEWSKEDQEKSHGPGVLSKTTSDKDMIEKYLRRWFNSDTIGTWGKGLGVGLSDLNFGRYENESWITVSDSWPKKPVLKVLT